MSIGDSFNKGRNVSIMVFTMAIGIVVGLKTMKSFSILSGIGMIMIYLSAIMIPASQSYLWGWFGVDNTYLTHILKG